MCVLAFDWQPGAPEVLRLAGNRDEFHARPTAPLAWWAGGRILAGRDLQAGGTWLGVDVGGRLAALTNHRNPALVRTGTPSRGELPRRFLEGEASARAFLEGLAAEAAGFNPFNLLVFDGQELLGFESLPGKIRSFSPGIHGVSNGAFDDPWPKLEALKAILGHSTRREDLWDGLADATPFPEENLPRTGVSPDLERGLSPLFVRLPTYGTRASTLVSLGPAGVTMEERCFLPDGPGQSTRIQFRPGDP